MTSRKNKGSASRKAELEKRQNQRLEKRNVHLVTAPRSTISLDIKPKVGPNERDEDAAVYNKDYRLKLANELQIEAARVNESLELTYQGKFDDAIERLRDIPRSSPFADWRLFVRGLHSYYTGDIETARQNWNRLDGDHRPARIASTLLHAEFDQPLAGELPTPSLVQINHAKALRFRKEAVVAAETIAKVRHRDTEITFSISQVAMLANFFNGYRKLDNEFVSNVGRACVELALAQGDMDVFDRVIKIVPGPSSDPKWNRTRLVYALSFEDAQDDIEEASKAYINHDLPRLTHLPEQVRDALACKIYLLCAEEARSSDDGESKFSFSFSDSVPDFDRIDGLLRKAIQKCPTYLPAHEKLISSLESQVDDNDVSDAEEEELEREIIVAKEDLVRYIPSEVETSLELIDFYLDEDQLDKANALVQNLSGQRLEDPLAKALPWKLKLREAMRLSRRKSDLELANRALDEAESLWPTWLNRNWLAFLRAGLALRSGDRARFSQLTMAAREEQKCSDFVFDVMTFAALQQLNIPSSELKPFRAGVEGQLEKASKIGLADLFSLGSFFWDLVRTGLKHKGYRLQASKLGRAFADQIKSYDNKSLSATQIDAFSWGAHHQFWPLGNDYLPTPSIKRLALQEPRLAAAVLEWLVESDRFPDYLMIDYQPMVTLVKEAARNEKDPFYRYQFDHIADVASEIIAEAKAEDADRKSFGSSRYDEYDDDEYDDDDDDEGDDEGDDAICDCPNCRAKRARMSGLVDDDDDDDDEDGQGKVSLRDLPLIMNKVTSKLGFKGVAELKNITELQNKKASPEQFIKKIGSLFFKYGLSMQDTIDFFVATQQVDLSNGGFSNAAYPDEENVSKPIAGLTAEERKADRKQREKELEKKKREVSQSRSRR